MIHWKRRLLRLFIAGVVLYLALSLFVTADAVAQPAFPSGPLSGALFPESNSFDYEIRDALAIHSQDPDILENRLHAGLLLPSSASNIWSIYQTVDSFHLSRSPMIPQTGVGIPQDLWTIETGASLDHRYGDRHGWGLSVGVGTSTDAPYDSIHEMTLRATATYRIPSGEQNTWLFLLSYSNNRYFANGIPLPGVAYLIHSPEHHIDAVIGFPFLAVRYAPTPELSGRLSLFGPGNLSAEIADLIWSPLQAYIGFDWNYRQWAPADRAERSERLFLDEKKASAGIRFPIAGAVRLDLSGGYEFDRRMYESKKARIGGGVSAIHFEPAVSVQAKLGIRF